MPFNLYSVNAMYPRFSDLINDLLGTNIILPFQTYGFFVAVAFMAGGWILFLELKRKEKENVIQPYAKTRIKGKPAGILELVINAVISFIIGFKMVGIMANYYEFAANPQQYFFSPEGSLLGGLFVGAAFTYYVYYIKDLKKSNPPEQVTELVPPKYLTGNIILVAAIFGIIGSKLFDVIEHIDQLIKYPIQTLFSFSGLAFYGGLITAAFAVSIYVEKHKIPWAVNADAIAPALMLAYGIGRIGCQLAGDGCWGIENLNPKPGWLAFLPDWMWAFNYPNNVINHGILIPGCTGSNCHVLGQPVFPTPFYETVIAFLFFGVLWLIRKRLLVPGFLFSTYLILNGTERLLIEQLRVNIRYDILGMKVTQAVIIAICLIIVGIVGYYYFNWDNKRKRIQQLNES
jgi:phosphatidylglycerol---prolipoprotein diacylglyceryl transferase